MTIAAIALAAVLPWSTLTPIDSVRSFVAPVGLDPIGPPPDCSPTHSPPPSTIQTSLPAPSGTWTSGAEIGISYEIALVGSSSIGTVAVDVPTLSGSLPGLSPVVIPPRSIAAVVGEWTANLTEGSKALANGSTIAAGSTISLSSSLLAVTASAPYGAVAVALRWEWTIAPTGGSNETSGWSTPSQYDGTLFYPQPHLTLLSNGPASSPPGGTYELSLAGGGPGNAVLVKLELASTGATQNEWPGSFPSSPGTPLTMELPLQGTSGTLAAGAYLVHVHGACGGILYSLPVTIT